MILEWDNLALNPDDPFAPYAHTRLSECNSALCYQSMYQHMHINKHNNELLCPLILYVDKTNVDKFSRFALKPFSFTSSIFNYKTRCHINAWRVLGYVQDTDHKSRAQCKKMQKGESLHNYHHQLKAILHDVITAQNGHDKRLFNVPICIGNTALF